LRFKPCIIFANRKRLPQWAKSKSSLQECIFDNMALCFECQINKNALLKAVFLVILPTGTKLYTTIKPTEVVVSFPAD